MAAAGQPAPQPAAGRPRSRAILGLVLAPVLVVIALVWGLAYATASVCLHAALWTWWSPRGRDVLFVYSDSPVWRTYVDERILPHLRDRAVLLNWSERRRWRPSLARWTFRHFGGTHEFNPLAIVFRPFRPTRTFRFWQPFKDFKHGRPSPLHALEQEFFAAIGANGETGGSSRKR